MSLKVGCVDHDRLRLGASCSQTFHHSREHTGLAPTLPPIVQRLVWPIGAGRISPAQPIAVDEDDAAQNPSVVHPRPAVALGKERPQPLNLLIRQPKQACPD